jgi:hypothetical protein
VKVLQIEPNTTCRKHNESAHMSLIDHPNSQPSLDISRIWTHLITAEVRKLHTTPSSVVYVWKLCLYISTIQRISHFSDDFCSYSALILTIPVKQCMDVGVRTHVCGVFFFKILVFVLTLADGLWSAWFISCIGYGVWGYGLALSIGPNWKRRENPVSKTLCVLNKNRTMDNVQEHNNCR